MRTEKSKSKYKMRRGAKTAVNHPLPTATATRPSLHSTMQPIFESKSTQDMPKNTLESETERARKSENLISSLHSLLTNLRVQLERSHGAQKVVQAVENALR